MKYALATFFSLIAAPAMAASHMPNLNVREVLWDIFVLAAIAVCFGLADYAVQKAPFMSEPIKQFIHWAIIVVACVLLIFLILNFFGL